MEWVIGLIAVGAIAFFAYKMMKDAELLDMNKDGKVNAADAEVVVKTVKRRTKKAIKEVTGEKKPRAPRKPRAPKK